MESLVGKKVIIYSEAAGQERQDVGVLEGIEPIWLRLRKSDTEVLYFCVYQVRVVKPFDAH